jgi:hypothetical protein
MFSERLERSDNGNILQKTDNDIKKKDFQELIKPRVLYFGK